MKQNSINFAEMVNDTFYKIKQLTESKGEEYTGRRQSTNQHDNFDRASVKLGLTPETVLAVYLGKHMDSIDTWIRDLSAPAHPAEYSEPITGRIDDAILYLLLLKGMVWRRGQEKYHNQQEPVKEAYRQARRATDLPLPLPGEQLEKRTDRVLGGLGVDRGYPPASSDAAGKAERASARPDAAA